VRRRRFIAATEGLQNDTFIVEQRGELMIDANHYKDAEDDVVIVNSDWSVVRLSASLLAQETPERIRQALRQIYRDKYAARQRS
jgi:very-short-patch-repair endonuclease